MDFIKGTNRDQIRMVSLGQLVPEDSWARIVDQFVYILPIDTLGFRHSILNKEGRQPFAPGDMLKLYLYCYKYGIRSSYKIHHQAMCNVEVWWLLKDLKPSVRKIQYFRKQNADAIKKAFKYFGSLLKQWELLGGHTVAIDSFKIRAQNSLKNNFNQKKIDRHVDYIDNKISDYLDQLERSDIEEDKILIEQKIEHQKNKKKAYQEIESQLKQTGQSQLSTTDPDARAVILHRNIVNVGYNVQATSDSKYKLLIDAETGNVNDTKDLARMSLRAKEIMDCDHLNVLADKGYHTGKLIKECEQNNITTFISPKESSSTKKNPKFAMSNFDYNEKQDTYICPANQILKTNGNFYNKKGSNGRTTYRVKHYKTKACTDCPLKSLCTINSRGRLIERSEYQTYIDRNNQRVRNNPDYYRQRQQIIEHQFGTLKRQMHFDHTLMRGKENVMTEIYISFICYNLRRLMSIFDLNELKTCLKKAFYCFLVPSCSRVALCLFNFKIFSQPPLNSKFKIS